MIFGALHRKPSLRHLSRSHGGKEGSTPLSPVLLLRFIPRAQTELETVQKLQCQPPGPHRITSPTGSLTEAVSPSGELCSPPPTASQPPSPLSTEVGWESRRRCQQAKAVLSFFLDNELCSLEAMIVLHVSEQVRGPGRDPGSRMPPTTWLNMRPPGLHGHIPCPAAF